MVMVDKEHILEVHRSCWNTWTEESLHLPLSKLTKESLSYLVAFISFCVFLLFSTEKI